MSSALQHIQHTLCFLTGKKRMFKLIYFCHFGQFHTSNWHYVFVRINFPHTIKNMSKKSSRIWVNILQKSLSSNKIEPNQSATKPCTYFMGYIIAAGVAVWCHNHCSIDLFTRLNHFVPGWALTFLVPCQQLCHPGVVVYWRFNADYHSVPGTIETQMETLTLLCKGRSSIIANSGIQPDIVSDSVISHFPSEHFDELK